MAGSSPAMTMERSVWGRAKPARLPHEADVVVGDAGAVPGAQLPVPVPGRSPDLLGHGDGESGARLVHPGDDRLGPGADPVLGAAVSRHLAGAGFGMAGDRVGQRAIIAAMRAAYAVLAAAVTALAFAGALDPMYVFIIAALSGLIRPS